MGCLCQDGGVGGWGVVRGGLGPAAAAAAAALGAPRNTKYERVAVPETCFWNAVRLLALGHAVWKAGSSL